MFEDVKEFSMTDLNILDTDAYKYIQANFNIAVQHGPLFVCNICWKCEFRTNVNLIPPNMMIKMRLMKNVSQTVCHMMTSSTYADVVIDIL